MRIAEIMTELLENSLKNLLQISSMISLPVLEACVSMVRLMSLICFILTFFVFHTIIPENNIMVTQPIKKYEIMVFLKKLLVLNCLIISCILFIVKSFL